MIDAKRNRERLQKLTKICLALPGAAMEEMHGHVAFKVGKKTFAYYLNDHHGDGIVSVCCKVLAADNKRLIEANPRRFYMPAYIGPRGWVALRLDRATVDWSEVQELVRGSYEQMAPKKLVQQLGRD
ncbi:MmcQ/YjbR family DNA-binding protein [Occallatibacter savannae]|uniref:MmcQ/YjbR family DNA-binding protein n=1 Tax=Occallatibacter savannae TaxID=1002691 RepID=UPI000D68FC14|nr:MmcQ/YjbR family DNA-binding protein [Occallatibacter savannae]